MPALLAPDIESRHDGGDFRLDVLMDRTFDTLQSSLAECIAAARCPICRVPLVARMCRCGPRFPCRCPGHEAD
jgi:hypothetical protein